MTKIDTLFLTKTAKQNRPVLGRTYLYSPYKGVPPGDARGINETFLEQEHTCPSYHSALLSFCI